MIELSEIRKRFDRKVALDGVNIVIGEGDGVALIGESGSGKTTLSRILLRLADPDSGTYRFEGQDVLKLKGPELRRWRRNVQTVFQNPSLSLNPRLRVERLLTEPLEVAEGLDWRQLRSEVGELLEMVGLPTNLGRRYPHQLSGGQRQRVAIARAFSIRPKLLVLDEPVSALDVSVRAQILNLLRDLIKEFRVTVVYISHDLAIVPYICNRAYVLYKGRVMEEVSAAQLVTDPDNPYSRLLLDSVLAIGRQANLYAPIPELGNKPAEGSCRFAPRCPHAQDVCRAAEPDFVKIAGGWSSRCHFAGQAKPLAQPAEPLRTTA